MCQGWPNVLLCGVSIWDAAGLLATTTKVTVRKAEVAILLPQKTPFFINRRILSAQVIPNRMGRRIRVLTRCGGGLPRQCGLFGTTLGLKIEAVNGSTRDCNSARRGGGESWTPSRRGDRPDHLGAGRETCAYPEPPRRDGVDWRLASNFARRTRLQRH